MKFDTQQVVTMTEANQNFSKVVKVVDSKGSALIFKNNKPKYLITRFNDTMDSPLYEDVIFFLMAKQIIHHFKEAFNELAK